MTDESLFTAADKQSAIEREIKYRERVFDRLVEAGKMTKKTATFQIAIFRAIADDYAELAKQERLI